MDSNKTLILFDGVCNLCNGSVKFILKHDSKDVFRFAALQSEMGQKLCSKLKIDTNVTDTVIVIEGEKFWTRSDAALRVFRKLPRLWPALYGLVVVPKFIRNFVYNIIARNRYRWFGKRNSCMIPNDEIAFKFTID